MSVYTSTSPSHDKHSRNRWRDGRNNKWGTRKCQSMVYILENISYSFYTFTYLRLQWPNRLQHFKLPLHQLNQMWFALLPTPGHQPAFSPSPSKCTVFELIEAMCQTEVSTFHSDTRNCYSIYLSHTLCRMNHHTAIQSQ